MLLRRAAILGFALACCASGNAPAQAPKPPALPPINPAQARPDQTLGGLNGPGLCLAVAGSTDTIAAGCDQGTIQLWTRDVALGVRGGDRTPYVLQGHQGPVLALAWCGEGTLTSAGADRTLRFWDMPAGKVRQTVTLPVPVRALAGSPDGKQLVTGSDDGAVQFWDAATGQPGPRAAGHTDWIRALAFSPDGKLLASGGHDGMVRLWEAAAAKQVREFPAAPPPPANSQPPATSIVQALAFAPDGKLLAVGMSDGRIHLYNPADGKLVRTLTGHVSAVNAVRFHPGGTILVSGSSDRTVRLWNPANGQMVKSLEGHEAWVEGLGFLADGLRLASVGADRTVRLWILGDPPKN